MRCPRLTMLFTLMISLSFIFGFGLQKANAGACSAIGRSKGCVTSSDLKKPSVNSARVKDDNLKARDMKDEGGADFADGNQALDLSSTDTVARSVTITAPASGVVIVNASGVFLFNGVPGIGRCSITTGTVIDTNHLIIGGGTADANYDSFCGSRGYAVGAGSLTYNLVCDQTSGNVRLLDSSIFAIYTPTRY